MTAGSYCTYAVKFDGTVASVGEGSYGRLGHSHSDNARLLNNVESLQGEVFNSKVLANMYMLHAGSSIKCFV